MAGVHKRNGFITAQNSDLSAYESEEGRQKTNSRRPRRKKQLLSPLKAPNSYAKAFASLLFGGVVLLGSVQLFLNSLFFQTIEDSSNMVSTTPLQDQLDSLQRQLREVQEKAKVYVDDGTFYPFSIRDSRRLVPTQLPPEMHIWDYVDLKTQNQQRTKHADLFHNTAYQAKAVCQAYDLLCYKRKIIQVFELVLEQNPGAQYFFYMEADNELCVPLSEIRRLAYEHKRYFITTGIGFSGWIFQRQFMIDFLQALKEYKPPPRDPNDILDQQGPHPSEGPDPIAAEMLIQKNAWSVTRKYLVSHSIQPALGTEALTLKMPAPAAPTIPVNGTKPATEAKPPQLEKHLPRCFEPRRSKWRISRKDHRDRFGWDYFEYEECDGEVFPCYVGQLEEIMARDMAKFNYTQLDIERQLLIEKQNDRKRQKLLKQTENQQQNIPKKPAVNDESLAKRLRMMAQARNAAAAAAEHKAQQVKG